jgi:hypothetical protein
MSTNNVVRVDMDLEALVIPVADVDRPKEFYGSSDGGSTPTSPSITAFASFRSRRPARGARSNSAPTSRRPRPARLRTCTW